MNAIQRQGDILLVEVAALPEGKGEDVPRDAGRVILAYGEVTGHAHAVVNEGVTLKMFGASRYLVADRPFELLHEEHATHQYPAGVFEVRRQREYSPESIRMVAD